MTFTSGFLEENKIKEVNLISTYKSAYQTIMAEFIISFQKF